MMVQPATISTRMLNGRPSRVRLWVFFTSSMKPPAGMTPVTRPVCGSTKTVFCTPSGRSTLRRTAWPARAGMTRLATRPPPAAWAAATQVVGAA